MTEKPRIIDELGEVALLLPRFLSEALIANDQVKYYLTLLQAARAQALDAIASPADLSDERRACSIERSDLDEVVAGSSRRANGQLEIPHGAAIHSAIMQGIDSLIRPLAATSDELGKVYRQRCEQVLAGLPAWSGDTVDDSYIGLITSGQRNRGDTLHLIVMDAHKELTRLQTSLASESIGGASVYAIDDDDRSLIKAFMTGVQETAPLKFDHPGLGTTATRTGDTLILHRRASSEGRRMAVARGGHRPHLPRRGGAHENSSDGGA